MGSTSFFLVARCCDGTSVAMGQTSCSSQCILTICNCIWQLSYWDTMLGLADSMKGKGLDWEVNKLPGGGGGRKPMAFSHSVTCCQAELQEEREDKNYHFREGCLLLLDACDRVWLDLCNWTSLMGKKTSLAHLSIRTPFHYCSDSENHKARKR